MWPRLRAWHMVWSDADGRNRTAGGNTGSGAPGLAMAMACLALGGCEEATVNVIPVATVEISPPELTLLEGSTGDLSVSVRSASGRALTGRAIEWSSDDPAIATVSPPGRVGGEAPGFTRIRAVSEGVGASVPVTVLEGPRIDLSEDSLELRGPSRRSVPIEVDVEVRNQGHGELSGLEALVQMADAAGDEWLAAALGAPEAPATLRVVVHLSRLLPGIYRGSVTVSSPVALNSPRVVAVEVQVDEQEPELELDPTSLAFSAVAGSFEPATQEVTVENVGGGTLGDLAAEIVYVSGGAQGWLTAELDDSTAPTILTLQARAQLLLPGTYRAEVRVTAGTAPSVMGTVEVVFNVTALSVGGRASPIHPSTERLLAGDAPAARRPWYKD